MVGHKTKIILHSELYLCEERVSLGRLSKVEAKINMVNNQGISHIISFENISFKDGEENVL